MDDFGGRVRRVRESLAKTQRAVADAALEHDQHPKPTSESFSNHLSRVERGEELNPTLELIERIARGLDLTLSELFLRLEHADELPIFPLQFGKQLSHTMQHHAGVSGVVSASISERDETTVALALIEIATQRLAQLSGPASRTTKTTRRTHTTSGKTPPHKASSRKTGTRDR